MKSINVNKLLIGFSKPNQLNNHAVTGLKFTDGIKYLGENYACFWLIELILSYNSGVDALHLTEGFQKWQLIRVFNIEEPTEKFVLMADDGEGHILTAITLPFCSFNGDLITLFFTNLTLQLPIES